MSPNKASKLGVSAFFWCNEKSNLGTCILKYLSQPRFFRGCKRFLKRIAPTRCPQLGKQGKFSFSLCFVTRIRKRGAGSSMSVPRSRACVPLRLLRTTVRGFARERIRKHKLSI
jgi:hypothetical protein